MADLKKTNQQQVLFRFKTLRAPEFHDKKTEDLNFIFFKPGSGYFAERVASRPPGQTVKEAMIAAAKEFSWSDYSKLKEIFEKWTVAEWISRHKYSFNSEEVLKELAGLTDSIDVVPLWDNLFYQVLSQNDFYAKDLVIQMLVLEHMLAMRAKLNDNAAFLRVLPQLMSATVVIPLDLFPDEESEPEAPQAKLGADNPLFSTKSLRRSMNVLIANSEITSYQTAISEVKKLQGEYAQAYDTKYQQAVAQYDNALAAAYAAATPIAKTMIDCATKCEITYYEFENFDPPTFNFVPPKNVDEAFLQQKLTPESYYVVESLGLENSPTYDTIIDGIESAISSVNQRLYSNLPSGETVVGIGNMLFKMGATAKSNDTLSYNKIPFLVYFEPTSGSPTKGKVQIAFQIGYANAQALAAAYTATLPNNTTVSGNEIVDVSNGNNLNVTLYSPTHLEIDATDQKFLLDATITLGDGSVMTMSVEVPVKNRQTVSGFANVQANNSNDTAAPFIPPKFGIRRLGIEDYKKVVAEVCCYREAEVSNIINIMQGEFLSKTTTRERIEETTRTTERSTEKENLTDTTTNERFEMQTEIAKMLQQDKQMSAYAQVSGSYGDIKFEAGGNYATANSKEESNRQAVTQATEITQRAMERIVTKFREEVVTKITESFKEENSHIYDNRGGTGHISGVYRFINAIYKNKIYNYGKRLMYEFMVPEPSRIYRAGMKITSQNTTPTNDSVQIQMPADPVSLGLIDAGSLNEDNFKSLAAEYGAEVENPLSARIKTGKAYQAKGNTGSLALEYEFKIPPGYQLRGIRYWYSIRASNPNLNAQLFIGQDRVNIQWTGGHDSGGRPTVGSDWLDYTTPLRRAFDHDILPISLTGWDVGAFSMTLSVDLDRTPSAFAEWQIKTYDIIMRAYRDRLEEFRNQASGIQEEATALLRTNPLFYREFERITLKRNCISYLQPLGYFGRNFYDGADTFEGLYISRNQEMDDYASHAKFMEQAFEWDIMSYNFYPYYWGSGGNWEQLFQTQDDDPIFKSFMQSGMARVIVSVRPGFEQAVMHYMKFGVIWNGGEMPVIGDPLYLGIVDELKQPEYEVEETWETVVPTSLVGIQKEGVLVDQEGLPCGGGCEGGENPLVANKNVLPPPVTPATE